MTTEHAPTATSTPVTPGFVDVLKSEWIKVRSVRATFIQAILSVGLGLGMTALFCVAIGSAWDELSAQDRATINAAEFGSIGAFFALIVLIVFGVMTVSSEYTSGMIRLTLTATPRRTSVLTAKVLLIVGVTLALGFVVCFGSFFVAQAVFGAYGEVETASITETDALRSVFGSWLTIPVFPLLGAAAAVVLRSTAMSITATLGLLFVPAVFGGILPEALQEDIVRYFPNFAVDSLTTSDPEGASTTRLPAGAAIGVLAAWLAAFYFAAYVSLVRRDV